MEHCVHDGGAEDVGRQDPVVFLQPGEDPKDMVASASYQPLVDILQALRSHSERMVDQLASRALTRSTERRRIHVHPAPAPAAGLENGDMPEETSEAQQEVDRVTSVVVNFAAPRDAADIAALTRCRVIRPQSLVWLEGYQALVRWRAENGTGDRYRERGTRVPASAPGTASPCPRTRTRGTRSTTRT
ncbi:hypothetical protein ABZ946_28810 [Streptomyces sp. NPDC046324]|uniref:hypothetical protein n=1 Tax=Streptomyces sp. NPDC046324 TaxID=3154915 RepID=UPI0033D722FA